MRARRPGRPLRLRLVRLVRLRPAQVLARPWPVRVPLRAGPVRVLARPWPVRVPGRPGPVRVSQPVRPSPPRPPRAACGRRPSGRRPRTRPGPRPSPRPGPCPGPWAGRRRARAGVRPPRDRERLSGPGTRPASAAVPVRPGRGRARSRLRPRLVRNHRARVPEAASRDFLVRSRPYSMNFGFRRFCLRELSLRAETWRRRPTLRPRHRASSRVKRARSIRDRQQETAGRDRTGTWKCRPPTTCAGYAQLGVDDWRPRGIIESGSLNLDLRVVR